MPNSILAELVNEWRESGFANGDTILLHSNLKGLLRRYIKLGVELSPEIILQSLSKAVGPKGTLIFPLFNFDFAQGVTFDIRSTPSRMGALSEAARTHPDAIRTGHPIYSFAILGFHSKLFKGLVNFSGYGADSPFGMLRDLEGKVAVLNLPEQHSMTFYHHVEEMLSVPYRYHKIFSGKYIDELGQDAERKFGLFVRDLERGVVTDVNQMGELLWERGLYKGSRFGEGFGCRSISSRDLFDVTSEVILEGRAEGILYRIEK